MSSALANESVTYNHLTVDLRKRLFNTDSGVPLLNEPDLTQQIMEIAICVVATDSDITLSGEQTIQSVDVYANNFVCVNGQTDKTENGVYLCKDSNWERWADGKAGHFAKILKGTYASRIFHNINYELLYDTTEIEFEIVPNKVAELFDVSLSSLITNDILKFDGTNWINTQIPTGAENLSELNDVTLSSLVTNDALVWDGTKWVNLEIDGLPSGTVNQTLRHDGTSFVANSGFINEGNRFLFRDVNTIAGQGQWVVSIERSNTLGGCLRLGNASTNNSNYATLEVGGGVVGAKIIQSSNSQYAKNLWLQNGVDMHVDARMLFAQCNKGTVAELSNSANVGYEVLRLLSRNKAGKFKSLTVQNINDINLILYTDGTIFSNIFTANTVLAANASKEIVSITNGSGYLKNDGSGGFSWDTPGGGGVDELSELTDVELTSLATDDILQFDGSVWRNVELTTATLPTGTENQTLRYNSSNELEANSILEVTENGVIVDGTDGDEDTFTINHKGDSYYGLRIINSNEGTDVSSIQINDLLNGDILLINKNSNEWNVRFGDSFAAFPINFYIDRIKASTGETNIVTIDDTGLLGSSLLSSSDDIYTKVSSADTTSGYLNDKIDVVNITKEIVNPGANEVLRLTGFDGDYNSLTNKPTIPENLDDLLDVTLSSLATNDYLSFNGSNWVNSDRHNLLARSTANQPYFNIQTTPPGLTTPLTTFVKIGDPSDTGNTAFKNILKSGSLYYIDIKILLEAMDEGRQFEIQLNGDDTLWASDLTIEVDRNIKFIDSLNVEEYMKYIKYIVAGGIQRFEIFDVPYERSQILIKGFIDTQTADDTELSISVRNTETVTLDDDAPITISKSSIIHSTICN